MVKPWWGVTPPPRGQGYYGPYDGGLPVIDESRMPDWQKHAIAEAVHAGVTQWFKTATPEQIHELIFEPYEAFKKESK